MKRAFLLGALGVGGYLAYRALTSRDYRDTFGGKHVVITGGSRGLGLVLAREFAKAGARLSICSRDHDELARASDDLSEYGVRPVAVECDITARERVREFLAVARQQNGPVDVLVNNAGIIRVGPLETMREEDYEYALQTHFWGPLHLIEEVVPEMKGRGSGRIVNITSVGGKIGVPHLLPYCASKFALVGFSQGLRAELARYGIVVTTICPGLMRTGSPPNAEFKGQHEDEYAWFTLGDSLPGSSMSAESAARKILAATARGDAEVVLGLPTKLAVAAQAVAPNLTSALMALANKYVMPGPGGIGTAVAKGRDSRGKLPDAVTVLTHRAAERNNEAEAQPVPPPITVARK